jgi:SnoaL-like domain
MAYTDADLDELVSRTKIHEVLTRYCRAIDRCDLDLLRSVYWEDAIDDHGSFAGNALEFAEYVIPAVRASFEVTMHAITNVHMEVAGDAACTESYVLAYHKFRGDAAQAEQIFGGRYVQQFDWSASGAAGHHFFFGGRYLDRFERRGNTWRIFQRTVVMDWNHTAPSGEILDQGLFAALSLRGQRGPLDPVFGNHL